jgi:hypothetical protein
MSPARRSTATHFARVNRVRHGARQPNSWGPLMAGLSVSHPEGGYEAMSRQFWLALPLQSLITAWL